ncbi:MAG: NUDIX hydrolase [Candidatus Omnitrophica bacterium]|nr:NUDIX hydrolase [Candidatus Omnitrophota bacterium]
MRRVFSGKLLKVYVMKRKLPHGFTATFEMIRHPGAALIVPILSRDEVIMLRQLRPVIGQYIYEFPAGTLGRNESPRACAAREIMEETGYSAAKLTKLGSIVPVPGYSTERIIIFKAEGLKKVEHIPEKDEVIETLILNRSEVENLFRKGKITDAKTISALAMCGWI